MIIIDVTQSDPATALQMDLEYLFYYIFVGEYIWLLINYVGQGLLLTFEGPVTVTWATIEFNFRLKEKKTFKM